MLQRRPMLAGTSRSPRSCITPTAYFLLPTQGGIAMSCSGLLFVLSLSVLQVPPPLLERSHELDDARRKIEAREAAELNGLAQTVGPAR